MMTTPTSKKLIIYFDGTWNTADQKSHDGILCPTNISKLYEATLPMDAQNNHQIVHYIRGIGTRKAERIRGGGFGYGISDNIKEGYKFLVGNYQPGDEIYIFGFSRGAYTARSLAGLVRNLGILKRENLYLVNTAYKKYKDKSDDWHPDGARAGVFKEKYTWGGEQIRFLGVFDTVGALGAPFGVILGWIIDKLFKCRFHDTELSKIIVSAYHALAVDERRLPFMATLMTPKKRHDYKNFAQKWFPGVHSNVGGGYADAGLSDLALEWMAQMAGNHGLNIDLGKLTNPQFAPDLTKNPKPSQTKIYRLATIFMVKLPGYIKYIPKKYKEAWAHIRWNGDYIRPIAGKGDVGPFIGHPPAQSTNQYRGSLDLSVIDKINQSEDAYRPPNVC
jgi:uncharacterized protein (DUF2235 family)